MCAGNPVTQTFGPGVFNISISDGGNNTINIAVDACVLNAPVDFDATLKPASCTTSVGNTLSFTSGHVTLDDAHITLHFVADATITMQTASCPQHYDVTFTRPTR
jgi:hypothetical protein